MRCRRPSYASRRRQQISPDLSLLPEISPRSSPNYKNVLGSRMTQILLCDMDPICRPVCFSCGHESRSRLSARSLLNRVLHLLNFAHRHSTSRSACRPFRQVPGGPIFPNRQVGNKPVQNADNNPKRLIFALSCLGLDHVVGEHVSHAIP